MSKLAVMRLHARISPLSVREYYEGYHTEDILQDCAAGMSSQQRRIYLESVIRALLAYSSEKISLDPKMTERELLQMLRYLNKKLSPRMLGEEVADLESKCRKILFSVLEGKACA